MVTQNYPQQLVFHVDVRNGFTNIQDFTLREHMLERVYTEAIKLEFNIVIGRSDFGNSWYYF